MDRRAEFILLGAAISGIAGIAFICILASIGLFSSILPEAIIVQLPSILIVGASIGLVASYLGRSKWPVVIGATYGWISGLFTSTYTLRTLGLEISQTSILLFSFIVEVIAGMVFGSIPAVISRAIKRESVR